MDIFRKRCLDSSKGFSRRFLTPPLVSQQLSYSTFHGHTHEPSVDLLVIPRLQPFPPTHHLTGHFEGVAIHAPPRFHHLD